MLQGICVFQAERRGNTVFLKLRQLTADENIGYWGLFGLNKINTH